jgi:hypothetical protein
MSAASQWHARDPHIRATEVLAGPQSRRIMDQLRIDQPDRWAADALDEARCLACHTNPSLASQPRRLPREQLRAEGVSCEACHGNAGRWLFEHMDWLAAERPSRYDSLGMVKLYDLGERGVACAGCHVGAPADPTRGYPLRDMNHDMIVAGHPRLNFEFADYQRRLPPHWFEKDRTGDLCVPREPEFEAKAWLVGRVASAEAACRLLADRATRAGRGEGDWPELSETKCFACHRDLHPRAWQTPNHSRATWQTIWPLTRADHRAALAAVSGGKAHEVAGEFAALEKVLARREPRPAAAARHATRAADLLRELRSDYAALSDRAAAKVLIDFYSRLDANALDWDESCQATHGLASMEWVRLRRTPPGHRGINPLFAEIYSGLALPRPEGVEHFDSPRKFDPVATKAKWNQLSISVRASCVVRE